MAKRYDYYINELSNKIINAFFPIKNSITGKKFISPAFRKPVHIDFMISILLSTEQSYRRHCDIL